MLDDHHQKPGTARSNMGAASLLLPGGEGNGCPSDDCKEDSCRVGGRVGRLCAMLVVAAKRCGVQLSVVDAEAQMMVGVELKVDSAQAQRYLVSSR